MDVLSTERLSAHPRRRDVWRDDADAQLRLVAVGNWVIARAGLLEKQLLDVLPGKADPLPSAANIDVSGLETLDTAGAWLLHRSGGALRVRGCSVVFSGSSREHQGLLDEIASVGDGAHRPATTENNVLAQFASDVTKTVLGIACDLLGLVGFLGVFAAALGRIVIGRSTFRMTAFVHHLEHAGLRAIPIIALICFLIGAVVMQQGALQLATYGAEPYAAGMLGVLALREIGVLLAAVMVAGRSASAFTAEIGSMKMREEIDAMRRCVWTYLSKTCWVCRSIGCRRSLTRSCRRSSAGCRGGATGLDDFI